MDQDVTKDAAPKGERLAKRMAGAGLCSRREAEAWIAAGRVRVDGALVETPATLVDETSRIEVDGKPIPAKTPTRLFRFHKPAGLLTAERDPEGRPTLFSILPDDMPRVVTVGRLDLTTEGLLLLTTDGALAREMELPSSGFARKYRVRVYGKVEPERLAALKNGIEIDGVKYGSIDAVLERDQEKANSWISVTLREGKNREIRKVMQALSLHVTRLIRVSFGPFQLGQLDRGEVAEIPQRVLKDQLGHLMGEGKKSAPRKPRRPTLTAPGKKPKSRRGA
ncbi:MAG: pseudouridine synthase [Alphaproteobacteria bacterium]|nr:pseudouridine synthase [Alphaproteobacteria bacterium]